VLLGLLANYNKFEFQNPYRLRLDDFVNEGTIQKIIKSVGLTCDNVREKYVAIQDDLPEGWSITNPLSIIGLGAKAASPIADPEATKELYMRQYVSTLFSLSQSDSRAGLAVKPQCSLQRMTLHMLISSSALISSRYRQIKALSPQLVATYHSPHISSNMLTHLYARPSMPISVFIPYDY
jgi:hypothetical protein